MSPSSDQQPTRADIRELIQEIREQRHDINRLREVLNYLQTAIDVNARPGSYS